MGGPVAITGATGFIGRQIVSLLSRQGYAVRALARSPQLPAANVTWIRGTLEDDFALARLVEGAASVIHCAGAVRGGSAEAFSAVNARGTARLVRAACENVPGAPFLLISSLAAREPHLSWYAASKREAERVLEDAAGLEWTVFRPTAVYGPGDREIQPLLRLMRRGWLPVIAPPGARFSLLHVFDLAAAVLAWVKRPVQGAILELDDGTPEGYCWTSVAAAAAAAWQRPVRLVRVPAGALSLAARANLALSALFGREPMLTPGKVRELTHTDWVCDNTPALRALDWRPTIRFADALGQPGLVEL